MSSQPRWLPLPAIHHGIATSNFRPTPPPPATASSGTLTVTDGPRSPSTPSRTNRYSWSRDSQAASLRSGASSINGAAGLDGAGEPPGNVFEQEVMLGDEVYAFEHAFSEDGQEWYRGYVLPFQDIQAAAAQASSGTAPEPLVYLGIFPAACIHVRAHTADSQGVLREVFERMAEETGVLPPRGGAASAGQGLGGKPAMEPVLEEEDESGSPKRQLRTATGAAPGPRPSALSTEPKLQPPLPSIGGLPLASGPDPDDDQPADPLVDEIAYTVRDWNARLPGYLLARQYKRFDTVARYIRALLVARQQLVARLQTRHEEDELRREIVWTMNRGAVDQGLDIVVRDPQTGQVGTVEKDGDPATTWMSGIKLYTLQVLTAQAERALSSIKLDSVVDLDGQRASARVKTSRRARSHSLTATIDTSSRVLLEVKTLIARLPQGDTVEVFCSIYQGSSGSYLTEEFCVELDHGVPVGLPIGARMRTVFRGLRELDSTCFLIVRLVRKGMRTSTPLARSDTLTRETTPAQRTPSRLDPTVNGPSHTDRAPQTPQLDSHDWVTVAPPENRIRTPLGCAALALDRLRAGEGGTQDFHLDVFVPREDGSWASVPTELLSNQRGNLAASSIVDAVVITAEIETGASDPLPRHIQPSNPLDPFDITVATRNDLYLKVWQCSLDGPVGRQVAAAQKSALEVRLEVRNTATGQRMAVLQLGGSNVAQPSAETRSIVLPRTSRPLIAELNRISIPPEQCHALLTLYEVQQEAHNSPRPLGLAFLPLNSAPVAVHADGAFDLAVYPHTLATVESMRYLQSSPTTSSDLSADRITLRIQNVSCRTSNAVVLGLIQRKDREEPGQPSVTDLLHLVTFVPPLEIVKYAAELLDSIFSILSGNISEVGPETVQDLVCKALISILDAIHDRRFSFQEDPIQSYLEDFRWSATGIPLIKAVRRVIRNPGHAAYRQTAKHLAGLVGFVLASRRSLRTANGNTLAEHLKGQLDDEVRHLVADDLPAIFADTDAKSLGPRILVVQQLGKLAEALMTLYSRTEIGEMLIRYADLASIDMAPGKASQAKLTFLVKEVILGAHFRDLELRSMLLPNLCRILRAHLVWTSLADSHTLGVSLATQLATTRQAISAVAAIVHNLSASLQTAVSEQDRVQDEDNLEYVLSALLPHILSCFRITSAYAAPQNTSESTARSAHELSIFPLEIHNIQVSPKTEGSSDRGDAHPLAGEAAAVLLSLLTACPRERLLSYLVEFEEIHSEQETSQLVLSALSFGRDLLQSDTQTCRWWSYRSMARRALLSLLSAIQLAYLGNPAADTESHAEIWTACLSTALRLMSDDLALTSQLLPQQTRTPTWRDWSRSGDDASVFLGTLQDCKPASLQTHQVTLASSEVLATCLSGGDVAQPLVAIYGILLAYNIKDSGDLSNTQAELLRILDDTIALPNPRQGLDRFIFLEQLRNAYGGEDSTDSNLNRQIEAMLATIEGYMGLILRVTASSLAPNEYVVLALEAMSYVKRLDQKNLEAKWASRLHDHLVREEYFASAGLALAREASCLSWTKDRLRKDQLLTQAMTELDSAQNWELGIEVCQALVDYHKLQTFDSSRIATLLFQEAQMHAKIAKARPRPVVYFRTTLHNVSVETGSLGDYVWAVPTDSADRRLRAICAQFAEKYGQIELIVDKGSIAFERQGDQPYIQISSYYPSPDRSKDCIQLAQTLNPYFLSNDVCRFRRLQFRPQASAVERIEIQVADNLPNILPMSPVLTESVQPATTADAAVEEINHGLDTLTAIEAYLGGGVYQEDVASMLAQFEKALDLPYADSIVRIRQDVTAEPSVARSLLDYARRLAELLVRLNGSAHDQNHLFANGLLKLFAKNFADEIAEDPLLSARLSSALQRAATATKAQPPLPKGDADDSGLSSPTPNSPTGRLVNGKGSPSQRLLATSKHAARPRGGNDHGSSSPDHSDIGPAQSLAGASASSHERIASVRSMDGRTTDRPESRLSIGSKSSARSRMSARFGSLLSRRPSERDAHS